MDQGFPAHEPPPPPPVQPMPRPSVPTCGSCGYDLRGMTVESRCPECGSPVWRAEQYSDPHIALAITSLVCGLISIVSCLAVGPLAAIPAIVGVVTGEIAARRYKSDAVHAPGRGFALAGRITSWIGLAKGLTLVFAGLFLNSP